MAYQAPAQSSAPTTRLGSSLGEERIRRLLEERRVSTPEPDPLEQFARSPAQSIVAQEQAAPTAPSADDIVAEDVRKRAGPAKVSPQFEPSPQPFPQTSFEKAADKRRSQAVERYKNTPIRHSDPDARSFPQLPAEPKKPLAKRGPAPSGPAPEEIELFPAAGAKSTVRDEAKEAEILNRYNLAVEDGDQQMAQKALMELEAERKKFSGGRAYDTADVVAMEFARLPEQQRAALLDHFEKSADSNMDPSNNEGPSDEMIGVALDMAYGDTPAEKLRDAMIADANRMITRGKPELSVDLRGGFTPLSAGQPRRIGATPEEKAVPLTHRRLPSGTTGQRYPVAQGPNGEGLGQFQDVNGSLRPTAPQTSIMESLEGVSPEPPSASASAEEINNWEEKMIMAAVAHGLNVSKFENRGDVVAAGQDVLRRTQQLTGAPGEKGKYEAKHNPQGRPILVPTADTRTAAQNARNKADAKNFVRNFMPGKPTEAGQRDYGTKILQAAEAGQWDEVRQLKEEARAERLAGSAAAARQASLDRGNTQNMMNPRLAPSMFQRSIDQAATPEEVGKVLLGWGGVAPQAGRTGAAMVAQAGAQQAEAESERRAIDAQLEATKIAAAAKGKENGLDDMTRQINSALVASPNPTTALNRIIDVKRAAQASGLLPTGADVEYEAMRDVSPHVIATTGQPDNPITVAALNKLYDKMFTYASARDELVGGRNRQEAFIERARLELGVPQEFASQWIAARTGTSPSEKAGIAMGAPVPE